MRVVQIHFGKDGGSERFFVTLVNALHERGVDQQFFIRPDRAWRKDIEACGPIHEGVFRRISLSRFRLAARIARVMETFRPDAVLAWAPRASQALPGTADCIRITRLGDYPLRLRYFGNADVIIGNTPGIAARVRELGWPRQTGVISNFTSFEPAAPVSRRDHGTPVDAFLVVAAGRFVRRKGFHTLIEATAKTPGAYLWIIGDGEERANLEALGTRLGLADRLRFLGWQAKPAPYMAAGDVFVMPSSHEPLGNVVLEAWALGVPVVSSRSEGPSWFMTPEADGLMFPVEDGDALAEQLARLRDDAALRATLAAGGRRTLDERFSKRAITDAYLALFAQKPPTSA
jgi:glycosyltransferase involved in cell wall biosynthesis